MQKIIVNWVKEDEELLEPYEWHEYDDIEIISSLDIYHVDHQTLYDFIYGCLNVLEEKYFHRIFALSNGQSGVIVEIDEKGKLIYRSAISIESRQDINSVALKKEMTVIQYYLYDEGLMKEYGLTRNERLKKQYIEQKLDDIYLNDFSAFEDLCQQISLENDHSINKYVYLKSQIEHGYHFIHEVLYNELMKSKYKKNK